MKTVKIKEENRYFQKKKKRKLERGSNDSFPQNKKNEKF